MKKQTHKMNWWIETWEPHGQWVNGERAMARTSILGGRYTTRAVARPMRSSYASDLDARTPRTFFIGQLGTGSRKITELQVNYPAE